MWIALLLANAVLLLAMAGGGAWRGLFGPTLLVLLAVLIRPTSIIPSLPILATVVIAYPFNARAFQIAATIIIIVLMMATPSTIKWASGAISQHPERPLLVFDIVGVGMRQSEGRAEFVSERLKGHLTEEQLTRCYSPHTSNLFFWGECAGTFPAEDDALAKTWWRTILDYPSDYAKHRLSHIVKLLAPMDVHRGASPVRQLFEDIGTNSREGWPTHWWSPLPENLPISFQDHTGVLHKGLTLVQRSTRVIGFNLPFAWLAIAVLSIGVSLYRRHTLAAASIVAGISSIFNTATFALFGASAEPRYLLWSLLAAVLSGCFAMADARTVPSPFALQSKKT
jgi:hypothetical protein